MSKEECNHESSEVIERTKMFGYTEIHCRCNKCHDDFLVKQYGLVELIGEK